MKQVTKRKIFNISFESIFFLASFLLPFLLLIIIFSSNGFALNFLEGNTIISIDFQSQYIAYLRYYREMLINDGFINVYTLSKVFGGDFYSIFTYYLSSPFNLLIRYISEEQIPIFILWINIIKMSLAGLFMYTLLRVTLKKNKIINIGISLSYALLAYGFIYNSNFMWLDAVMVLPLIVLGIKLLFEKKNPVVYIISLAYAYLTSWYMGALLTVFIGLFFIAEFIGDQRKFKEKYSILIKFFVFSLVAALLSAANWLTAFTHFEGTKASSSFGEIGFLPFTMFFTGMLENGYGSHSYITMNVGYMPIFVSIGCVALAIMFFFNKGYNLKLRLSFLTIFVFYYLFSSVNNLNALLHGGREPTWFPARFAFCISFFICYLAALAYNKRKEIPIYGTISPLVIATIILPIVVVIPNELLPDNEEKYSVSIISVVIFLLVVGVLLLEKFLPKKIEEKKAVQPILSGVLLVLLAISAYRGGDNVIKNNLKSKTYYQTYETYLKDDSMKDFINEDWNSTYRVATTFNRQGSYNTIDNNPMFYGFNGLSNYSSSSKQEVEGYLTKLGFHYNNYFAKYDGGSTLSINSLLGVKYIYSEKNHETYFLNSKPLNQVETNGDFVKYENTYALPLAFFSKATNNYFISEGESREGIEGIYWYDHFEYQNQIFKTLSGLNENIFTPLEEVSFSAYDLTYTTDEFGIRSYTSTSDYEHITITYKYNGVIDDMHNFYYAEKSGINATTYFDFKTLDVNNYWHKGIRSLDIKDNNTHKITIYLDNRVTNRQIRPGVYVEDLNVLQKHLEIIKDKYLNLTVSKNIFSTTYKGTITTDGSMDDLIFTLPFEKQFKVKIDGKEVETYKKLNIFTAVDIKGLTNGEHTVEIIYLDSGYIAGFTLTLVGILVTSTICLYYLLDEKKLILIKEKLKFFNKKK